MKKIKSNADFDKLLADIKPENEKIALKNATDEIRDFVNYALKKGFSQTQICSKIDEAHLCSATDKIKKQALSNLVEIYKNRLESLKNARTVKAKK